MHNGALSAGTETHNIYLSIYRRDAAAITATNSGHF
jgi:hypothetical protein